MDNNKSLVELPKSTLVSITSGSVIVNKRVIAYPSYDGTIDGLITYYGQLSAIHQWSDTVLGHILEAANASFKVLNDKGEQTPFTFGQDLPAKPRSKGLLIYGIVMISLVIMLNICIIALHNRITWNVATHYCLSILTLMGCFAFALCIWTYNSNKPTA